MQIARCRSCRKAIAFLEGTQPRQPCDRCCRAEREILRADLDRIGGQLILAGFHDGQGSVAEAVARLLDAFRQTKKS